MPNDSAPDSGPYCWRRTGGLERGNPTRSLRNPITGRRTPSLDDRSSQGARVFHAHDGNIAAMGNRSVPSSGGAPPGSFRFIWVDTLAGQEIGRVEPPR